MIVQSRGHRGFPVAEAGVVGTIAHRRQVALSEAADDARKQVGLCDPDSWRPATAARAYGPGCLALALAGTVDQAGVEHLRALRPEVDRLAGNELALELSGLTECGPSLVQVLAGLRIARLAAGARVELHTPPAELTAVLGQDPVPAFTIRDDPTPSEQLG